MLLYQQNYNYSVSDYFNVKDCAKVQIEGSCAVQMFILGNVHFLFDFHVQLQTSNQAKDQTQCFYRICTVYFSSMKSTNQLFLDLFLFLLNLQLFFKLSNQRSSQITVRRSNQQLDNFFLDRSAQHRSFDTKVA